MGACFYCSSNLIRLSFSLHLRGEKGTVSCMDTITENGFGKDHQKAVTAAVESLENLLKLTIKIFSCCVLFVRK